VLETFCGTFQLSRTRFSVVGRADTVPIDSNETAEGRARNRRVDVVILNSLKASSTRTPLEPRPFRRSEPAAPCSRAPVLSVRPCFRQFPTACKKIRKTVKKRLASSKRVLHAEQGVTSARSRAKDERGKNMLPLSLQTNVTSLFAQQQLEQNDNAESNTIEQLTSGYRINSAGDDAAGLAVANELQANITELQQGVINAANGNSILQIMDGGLSNISNLLDRLQTLATEGQRNVRGRAVPR
jgi:hypothetical protein